MEYLIDESTWLNWDRQVQDVGNEGLWTMLYRPYDGMMCCLGHIGVACGVSKESMAKRDYPMCIRKDDERLLFPQELRDGPVSDVANLNDLPLDVFETMADRQVKIVKLFKEKYGITVRFVPSLNQ